jgi:hypothetical protein
LFPTTINKQPKTGIARRFLILQQKSLISLSQGRDLVFVIQNDIILIYLIMCWIMKKYKSPKLLTIKVVPSSKTFRRDSNFAKQNLLFRCFDSLCSLNMTYVKVFSSCFLQTTNNHQQTTGIAKRFLLFYDFYVLKLKFINIFV